jgi:hypothetical protein
LEAWIVDPIHLRGHAQRRPVDVSPHSLRGQKECFPIGCQGGARGGGDGEPGGGARPWPQLPPMAGHAPAVTSIRSRSSSNIWQNSGNKHSSNKHNSSSWRRAAPAGCPGVSSTRPQRLALPELIRPARHERRLRRGAAGSGRRRREPAAAAEPRHGQASALCEHLTTRELRAERPVG